MTFTRALLVDYNFLTLCSLLLLLGATPGCTSVVEVSSCDARPVACDALGGRPLGGQDLEAQMRLPHDL